MRMFPKMSAAVARPHDLPSAPTLHPRGARAMHRAGIVVGPHLLSHETGAEGRKGEAEVGRPRPRGSGVSLLEAPSRPGWCALGRGLCRCDPVTLATWRPGFWALQRYSLPAASTQGRG